MVVVMVMVVVKIVVKVIVMVMVVVMVVVEVMVLVMVMVMVMITDLITVTLINVVIFLVLVLTCVSDSHRHGYSHSKKRHYRHSVVRYRQAYYCSSCGHSYSFDTSPNTLTCYCSPFIRDRFPESINTDKRGRPTTASLKIKV